MNSMNKKEHLTKEDVAKMSYSDIIKNYDLILHSMRTWDADIKPKQNMKDGEMNG